MRSWIKRAALWLLVLLPIVLGYLAGVLVRLLLVIAAAAIEGYTKGLGR